jgi:tetratricopeptide (TPR) repeat protein
MPPPSDALAGRTSAVGDVTRRPLTIAIRWDTPPAEAQALRFAEKAREEVERGTTERAIELLDAAIRSSPQSVPPYVVRAQVLLAEGSLEQARADLEKAAGLEPGWAWLAEIVALRGAVYEVEGDRDAALASYRRALRISSANQTARESLARLVGP